MNILGKGNKVMKHLPMLACVMFMNKQLSNAGQVCVGGSLWRNWLFSSL